jgi:hypothetical protein
LVDSSVADEGVTQGKSQKKKGRYYAQYRNILGSMLESYRAESDMLVMTTRLVHDDLYVAYKELVEKKQGGWRSHQLGCSRCGEGVLRGAHGKAGEDADAAALGFSVGGDGRVWHVSCRQ